MILQTYLPDNYYLFYNTVYNYSYTHFCYLSVTAFKLVLAAQKDLPRQLQ